MGWTVSEVKATSFWEFMAAWGGFVKSRPTGDRAKLSDAEIADLTSFIEEEDSQTQAPGHLPPRWNGRGFEAS